VIPIGGLEKQIMSYRFVTRDTSPHDAKVKMTVFKNRYECIGCQKIIGFEPKI